MHLMYQLVCGYKNLNSPVYLGSSKHSICKVSRPQDLSNGLNTSFLDTCKVYCWYSLIQCARYHRARPPLTT